MALKEEQLKELHTYIGIDPENVESIEDAKKLFDKNFINVNNLDINDERVKPVFGRRIGEAETKFKQALKSLGVEFEEGELKDKKLEDLIDLGKDKIKSQISTLKESAGKTDDKKVQDLQTKLENLEKERTTLEEARKAAIDEAEKLKKDYEQKESQTKLQSARQKVLSEIRLIEMKPSQKIGFQALIDQKYNLSLEGDNLVVMNKDGQKIPNPKKAGDFLTAKDIFEKEAQEEGLIQLNPDGGKQFPNGAAQKGKPQEVEKPINTVAPRLKPQSVR